MEKQKFNGGNPWLNIWVRPRETIQKIVDYNPNHRLTVLSFIYGLPWLLSIAQSFSLGRFYSDIAILIVSLILAIPVGYIVMSISSIIFLWLGKLIRGQGNFHTIRAAIGWANIPNVISIVIWLVLIGIFREVAFHSEFAKESGAAGYLTIGYLIQLVFGVWAFVIFLHALGQVQKFSAWMALLNTVLVLILYLAIAYGFSYLTKFWGGTS